MSRRNIFEILAERNDLCREVCRIDSLFNSEKLLVHDTVYRIDEYTLKGFVAYFCFDTWASRGHCLDLADLLDTLNYDMYFTKAKKGEVEAFFVFSEIILNCWKMAEEYYQRHESIRSYKNFYLLSDIIKDCLAQYNYKAIYDEDAEQVLVIEDNPATSAVAEIAEPELSFEVLKYNHHALHGDINKKKTILLSLGLALEPKRDQLERIDKILTDNIFFMLNNMNLRHNNIDPSDKHYKKFVAEIDMDGLENWYDELYQMMLLGFLELDQVERSARVKTLKKDINKEITDC